VKPKDNEKSKAGKKMKEPSFVVRTSMSSTISEEIKVPET